MEKINGDDNERVDINSFGGNRFKLRIEACSETERKIITTQKPCTYRTRQVLQ
jgi:hypothetical protein